METVIERIPEIVNRLRQKPEFGKNLADPPMSHPFHKRYHAKPQIFSAIEDEFQLTRFVTKTRDIESLELKEGGLTLACIVMVPGKRWNFKSALEAECFVADYLGA